MNYTKSKAKTQAQIIRELEYWAMEKDNMYPNANRKSYSYALNNFKNFFFRLQKKQENQKSLNYWCVAWRWDFRQVVRFVYKVFNELQSFWALGSDILKKFIKRSQQILHKQKSYVYAKRGKELPQEPEPTQQELEEIWAELVSKSAKKTKYL
jgi:hypothetical protein